MEINHIHFYVTDAKASRDWFIHKLGFSAISNTSCAHTHTEILKSGSVCFVLSSPLNASSPIAQFLTHHPPGVADIAFSVDNLEAIIANATTHGAQVLQPPIAAYQPLNGYVKWSKIAAWGSLTHTLIEKQSQPWRVTSSSTSPANSFTGIDHVVLNVPSGELETAVAWYQNTLNFHSQQTFKIETKRSALSSQVMVSHNSNVQFPINEPASPNSQIQEFLDVNRGAGIQHIALQTANIISAITQFRSGGLSFLTVPSSYYTQLQQRQGLPLCVTELDQIARQQILVDWQETQPHALLLQTFTQPIFEEPTFFLEIIERRSQATGFGEGNFRALFEAIEREQIKRGSLQDCGR